ncbi:TonB family protein [Lampropedia puyangensis]|nr:TonB family protein [Lampropedia puyangensis]
MTKRIQMHFAFLLSVLLTPFLALGQTAQTDSARLALHIRSYLNTPAETPLGITAKVKATISHDGTVRTAAINQSSGNSQYDRAVLAAIWRANPWPYRSSQELDQTVEIEFRN